MMTVSHIIADKMSPKADKMSPKADKTSQKK